MLTYLKRAFVLEVKRTIIYPGSFWVTALTIPLYWLIQIGFLETIYSQTSNFVGYTKYEAYVLFGTFSVVQALGHMLLHPRLIELKSLVGGGSQESFDSSLVKPVDTQVLTTIGRFNFGNIGPLGIGIFVVLFGLSQVPHSIGILDIASYLFFICLGLAFFYLSLLSISTLLFWFPELQVVEALWEEFLSLGQYPTGLYRGSANVVLNIVVPITLMAAIPVEFLFGKISPYAIFMYTGIIISLFVLTRLFWNLAIRKYSGFSS